jgi:hypothetical protein
MTKRLRRSAHRSVRELVKTIRGVHRRSQ